MWVDVALGDVHVNRFDFPGLYSSQDSRFIMDFTACWCIVTQYSTIEEKKHCAAMFESGTNIVVLVGWASAVLLG